jgi:hypothetical protein
MPRGFESAYAYARACGSLARSYLDDRAVALASSHRVGEAWKSMFGEAPPALPESELATAAERALRSRPYEALEGIEPELARTDPFFGALVRKREIVYLEDLLAAAAEGRAVAPAPFDSSFDTEFDPAAYPDLAKMLRRSRYQWAIDSGLSDLPAVKNRLDRQYFAELWAAARELPEVLADAIPALMRTEAELENVAWALRLKRYYRMGAAEIEGRLVELDGAEVRARALEALAFRPDARSDWAGWKWSRLVPGLGAGLGPGQGGAETGEWRLSHRGLEAAARKYRYRLLKRCLHLHMDSYTPLYAFFRLKEMESDAMRGIVEGIKLEAPAAEIAAAAQSAGAA